MLDWKNLLKFFNSFPKNLQKYFKRPQKFLFLIEVKLIKFQKLKTNFQSQTHSSLQNCQLSILIVFSTIIILPKNDKNVFQISLKKFIKLSIILKKKSISPERAIKFPISSTILRFLPGIRRRISQTFKFPKRLRRLNFHSLSDTKIDRG